MSHKKRNTHILYGLVALYVLGMVFMVLGGTQQPNRMESFQGNIVFAHQDQASKNQTFSVQEIEGFIAEKQGLQIRADWMTQQNRIEEAKEIYNEIIILDALITEGLKYNTQ